MDSLTETIAAIAPADARVRSQARERLNGLAKPLGSLGVLEDVAVTLAGLSRRCPPPVPEPAAVAVFAADHGVHARGVTPWPQEVTGQMVATFVSGGAAVNAFAAQVDASVLVVDVGVAHPVVPEGGAAVPSSARRIALDVRRVRAGTRDMTVEPAMTREEACQALDIGIDISAELIASGNRCLLTGDMGIGNTTASAALVAAFTGSAAEDVTGRGSGADDETWARKVDVVRTALTRHRLDVADPLGVLAAVGGLEHAGLAGLILGAAARRVPVVLDGLIAGAAALVAVALAPAARDACIAGHRSAEPGHPIALEHLGLRPLLDLDLRLGEGTGALLALPLVQCAARALADMASLDSAGVTGTS